VGRGIDQNGDLLDDTYVADLTGLLDLGRWHTKIQDLRIIVRDEPLHPRYRKRATEREKQLGRRYQLIAINTKVGQVAWLDARHRSHVHVENDVTQAKDLGLNRLAIPALDDQRRVNPDRCPGRESARLLPPPGPTRGRAPRRGPENAALLPAAPARTPDPRSTQTAAPPPRRLALDQRRDQRLASGQGTDRPDLTTTTPSDDHGRTWSVEPGAPDATVGPRP